MRGGGDRYNPLDVLSSATAVTVLGELSIGGSLMRGPQPNSAIRMKFSISLIEENNVFMTLVCDIHRLDERTTKRTKRTIRLT